MSTKFTSTYRIAKISILATKSTSKQQPTKDVTLVKGKGNLKNYQQ
jgi:hypothetical protein